MLHLSLDPYRVRKLIEINNYIHDSCLPHSECPFHKKALNQNVYFWGEREKENMVRVK